MATDDIAPVPHAKTLQNLLPDVLLSLFDHIPYPSLRQLRGTSNSFARLISDRCLADSKRDWINHLVHLEYRISLQIASGQWATPALNRPPFNTTASLTNPNSFDGGDQHPVRLTLADLWTPVPYLSSNPDAVSIASSFKDLWLSHNIGFQRQQDDEESNPSNDNDSDHTDDFLENTHGDDNGSNILTISPPPSQYRASTPDILPDPSGPVANNHAMLQPSYIPSTFPTFIPSLNGGPICEWPCYTCFFAMPAHSFAKKHIRGRRTFGHKDAGKRFCIECGVQKRFYVAGMEITCGGGRRGTRGVRVGFSRCGAGIGQGGIGFLKDGEWTGGNGRGCGMLRMVDTKQMRAARYIEQVFQQTGWRREILLDCCAWKEKVAEDVEGGLGTQGNQPSGIESATAGTTRQGRCQRCWAIDHTSRVVEGLGMNGEPLCGQCLEMRDVGVVSGWPSLEE